MSKQNAQSIIVPVTIVKTVKGIAQNIASVKTSGRNFESLVHSTAVSILVHVGKHGNINQALALIEALPSLTRKNALISWFMEFGCFGYNETTKKLIYRKATTNVTGATACPFWMFKPEVEFKPLTAGDFMKRIESLIAMADKSIAATNDQALVSAVERIKKAA